MRSSDYTLSRLTEMLQTMFFFTKQFFINTKSRKSLEILLLWLTGLSISFTIQHECQQWIIYSGLYCIASMRIDVFSSKFINSPALAPGIFLCCHFLNGIYAERHFSYLMRTAGEWTLPQNFLWFLTPVSNDQWSTLVAVWKCLKRMRCVLSRSMGRFLVLLEMLLS